METRLPPGRMDPLFHALAHPVRLQVVQLLLDRGPLAQEALVALVGELKGTVSKHLAVLANAHLVQREKRGRPWELVDRDGTARLIRAAADLNAEIYRRLAAAADEEADRAARRALHLMDERQASS